MSRGRGRKIRVLFVGVILIFAMNFQMRQFLSVIRVRLDFVIFNGRAFDAVLVVRERTGWHGKQK